MAAKSRLKKGLLPAIAVTALLALYGWQIVGRGVALISTGKAAGIGIGAAVLLIPLLCIWLVAREWMLAGRVDTMAETLRAAGELPADTLPRSPSGRIDRAAADAAFTPAREAAEADPDNWKAWYHLAFAYDAAGDRKRARGALRTASGLFDKDGQTPGR